MSSGEYGDRVTDVNVDLSPGLTPVLGLKKPERNDDYAEAYWEMVDVVDQLLVARDTWNNRPTDAPDGYLFYATDHEKFYQMQGGSWVGAGGTGTDNNPVQEVHAERVSVKSGLQLPNSFE